MKLYNFRDLGGLPTKCERTTKSGLLFRTGNVAHWSDEAAAHVAGELGVKLYIDLRNPDEVEKIVLLPIETLLQHGLKPVEAREEHYRIQSIGISWEGELIWGATAKMLEQIHEILGQIIKETS
jgi:hypothetical protein